MTLDIDALPRPPRARRFTRAEFHRMSAEGYFENQRVELLDGEIIEIAPQNEPHVGVISQLIRIMTPALPADLELRCQAPLSIGNSDPEPDIAIIRLPKPVGTAPQTATLVVEVADSSLAIDRKKANLYASAGIPEYWIINLLEHHIERFTQPQPDPAAPFGARYTSISRSAPKEVLEVLAIPALRISLAILFPE
jgi:Uma2 family endonuclease